MAARSASARRRTSIERGDDTELFDRKLTELYLLAGEPSTRAVADRTGAFHDGPISRTSVHTVLRGGRLPSWRVVSCVVRALDGDVDAFQRLWVLARQLEARELAGDETIPWQAGLARNHAWAVAADGPEHGAAWWAEVLAGLAPDTSAQLLLAVAASDLSTASDLLHELCRMRAAVAVASLSAMSDLDTVRAAHLLEAAARRHIGSVAMLLADSPDSVVLSLAGAIRRGHRCLLPLLRSVLGEGGSPGSLTARHEQAARLGRERAWSRSVAEYEALLKVRVRLLGDEHTDTLANRLELGDALAHVDRWRDAALQYRTVVRSRRRSLGEDHADTLDARYRYAIALRAPAQAAQREAELRALLDAGTRCHGARHAFTLKVRHQLAAEHDRAGRVQVAEQEYRAVLDLQVALLGPDAAGTLATHRDLGLLLVGVPGRHSEAERQLRLLLRRLPAGHADITVAVEALAGLAHLARHYSDEASYRQELLRLLPAPDVGDLDNARRVLNLRYRLATAWRLLGRTDEAEAEYRLLLARQGELFGPDDLDTLATQLQLGHLLRFQERLTDAASHYQAAYHGRRGKLGACHRDTLTARHHLATALNFQGQLSLAATHYRAVLAARRKVLGRDHRETLATWHRLAANAALSGCWQDAEHHYRHLLDAHRKVSGARHPRTIAIQRQLDHLLASQAGAGSSAATISVRRNPITRMKKPDSPPISIEVP